LSIQEGKSPRDYLAGRHLSPDQIAEIRDWLFAPMDGAKTVQLPPSERPFAQIDRGYRHRLRKKEGTSDSNAGAIDLPRFVDAEGQVVGFSARKLKEEEQSPKYVNSPGTKIFDKGKILYQLP
jgi:DNA primase